MPLKYVAIKKWKDGGETVIECFLTQIECLRWIYAQPKPKSDEFVWMVGEY